MPSVDFCRFLGDSARISLEERIRLCFRDLTPHKLRKSVIKLIYELDLEVGEDGIDSLLDKHKDDTDSLAKELCEQHTKHPFVDVLCGRKRITCRPGRGTRKTIRADVSKLKRITTHTPSSTLGVRELLTDDRNPPGSLRNMVAWTDRVQAVAGSNNTWQDRQQGNVAARAGALALLIVSDCDSQWTPEHVDPACDIPVVGVTKREFSLLGEHTSPQSSDENQNQGPEMKLELKLTVNGGRTRYFHNVTKMLTGLPHDALLKSSGYRGGEMPIEAMGTNPLLDWRLVESVMLTTFRHDVFASEPLRSKEVKALSVRLGRSIYEPVLRLAPTPQHFTSFWLQAWGTNFDPLCENRCFCAVFPYENNSLVKA